MYLQVVSAFALSNKNDLIRDDYHKLMRAFRALDPEKKGYIDAELFGGLMSSRGESFSTQETNTMLRYVAGAPLITVNTQTPAICIMAQATPRPRLGMYGILLYASLQQSMDGRPTVTVP